MENDKLKKIFQDLPPSSQTGRHIVYSKILNRTFVVEPISDHSDNVKIGDWGDVNPATKKVEGSYGDKYEGAIKDKDSIITKENGFKEIQYLKPGESPYSYIERLEREFLERIKNEQIKT